MIDDPIEAILNMPVEEFRATMTMLRTMTPEEIAAWVEEGRRLKAEQVAASYREQP